MKQGPLTRILKLVKDSNPPYQFLLPATLLAFVQAAAALTLPLVTQDLIGVITQDGFAWIALRWVVLVLLVQALTGAGSHWLLGYAGHQFVAHLRHLLHRKLITLPIPFFDNQKSGELISRIMSDTTCLADVFTRELVNLLSGIATVVGAVIILWTLDGTMTLILFGSVFLASLAIVPPALKMQNVAKGIQDETANLSGQLAEGFGLIRLVKASCAEEKSVARGGSAIGNLMNLGRREVRIQAWLAPILSVGLMGALVVILSAGGVRVRSGELDIGEWIAFIFYLFHVTVPVLQFSTFFAESQRALGASDRILKLLDEPEEELEGEGHIATAQDPLVLEDLRFTYPGNQNPVLQNFDLTIPQGKVTALVGPSGAGKSTILALLERFYDPQAGALKLGSKNIKDFKLRLWRSKLGYVAQDAAVIDGSIEENLCFGLAETPAPEEIERAAEQAHALEFIKAMPQGFQTQVGERGLKLSGGQRQRLAIARTLLKNPEILMLDEATSNLDSHSEHLVQKALSYLMQQRTTLVVAHRLSTVVNADQIAVMEHGRITGTGTHEDLMANHDFYQQLVTHQFVYN